MNIYTKFITTLIIVYISCLILRYLKGYELSLFIIGYFYHAILTWFSEERGIKKEKKKKLPKLY